MTGSEIGPRALGALAVIAVTTLAACTPFGPTEITPTPEVTVTTSHGPTPSPSPSATRGTSASPSPSPSATISGPIQNAPVGSVVSPEVFLSIVDATAGELQVVANVPGITENGGMCTVTVTAGSVVISKTSTGAANVTTTECGQFTFPLSELPAGTASIVVAYQSASYSGLSNTDNVTLP